MPQSRSRFTVRNAMITVAILGLVLAGSITALRMTVRSLDFRSRAEQHAAQAQYLPEHIALCRQRVQTETAASNRGGMRWWQANLDDAQQRLAFHLAQTDKYRQAARYPWREITPDPVEPYWDGTVPDELPPGYLDEATIARLQALVLHSSQGHAP